MHTKLFIIQKFIPPPENEGPGFAIQPKSKLGIKTELFATHREVENGGRFPQGKRGQQ